MRTILLIALISYLVGSIPFGYLLVRGLRGTDIRQSGSGNIGATNVARTSLTLGIVTLLLDALKGSGAVFFAMRISDSAEFGLSSALYWNCVVAAFCAVVGHVFPVWLRFRGGKGVATGLGAFILIAPRTVLVMIAVFLLVIAISRYVSLASMVAVALFPLLAWLLHDQHRSAPVLAIMGMTAILIIGKHYENIRRLIAGTENRLGAKRA
jgi:acyl phosphate:glycerol-3-phosphate acyltransferase